MLTIDRYLRPDTIEEAYAAAQKKNSAVLGGMLWQRLGNRRVSVAVDLCNLDLDKIEYSENNDTVHIGAYTSLRSLETNAELNALTCGIFKTAFSPIVGVQFRNLATVGGSVFGRFGFSDVVTALLALDADVCLYGAGQMSTEQFCNSNIKRDILTHVSIKNTPVIASYHAHRNTATDFPVLNTCAVLRDDTLTVAVGARPLKAVPYRFTGIDRLSPEEIANEVAKETVFATNCRASADYRRHLCRVLVRRAVGDVLGRQVSTDGLS